MPVEFEVKANPAALVRRASLSYPKPGTLSNEFADKVAIVTGASKISPMGIGAATAIELAHRGLGAVTITSTPGPKNVPEQ